ncbi:MAG: TSUP family transporter [Pelosinus sp.]|nr:TSUP family transporter [Pelosinus sp.]
MDLFGTVDIYTLMFLLASGFIAAFIDAAVGGGGLISLPALMMTGMPPQFALGTNKMASVMGSLTSTLSFLCSGKINFALVKYLFPIDFIGSVLGVYTVQLIPPNFLKPLVVVMLVLVTIYTFFKKDWGSESTYGGMTKRVAILSGLAAFAFGFYDGFFGPGTGSFLIFSFLLIGFDFVVAAGNAKALNFASNIAAVLSFGYLGLINYSYGITMGISMVFGAMAGSRVAITKGAAYVRPMFITMSVVLIGKQLWDVLK